MTRKGKVNKGSNINIITLGCSKNLVDSEVLMQQVHANGLKIIHNGPLSETGTVIINTCGFINDAKEESIDTILNWIRAKERGEVDHVYVMGCLSERYKEELQREIGEVDAYFGVHDLNEIVSILGIDYKKELTGERILATPKHFAYLKISEGCDRTCSFCAIPHIRGTHISRSMDDLLKEAEFLANGGVRELILIAQDTSYYGLDLYRQQKLTELVSLLSKVEGLDWIRIHYTYPSNFPLDLLSEMASNKKVCNYIDLPLQHINDTVLRNMRRNTTKAETIKLLETIRKMVPDAAIRTTMLVGHPGEREPEFQELREFIHEFRFDRLGVFTYSHEEGTHGYAVFKDLIPEKIKEQRANEIMNMQQNISLAMNREKIGKTFQVLVDTEELDYYVGRTEYDSPEVDQDVLIPKSHGALDIGQFYPVRISESSEFDLFGTCLNSAGS